MDEETVKDRASKLAAVFVAAMASAVSAAGSQKALSKLTGIHQSRISDYTNGNYDFNNLTVGTLIKLFPDLEIIYHAGNANSAGAEQVFDKMEKRILAMFRQLDDDDKVLCFEMMSRTFGDKFKEDVKG